MNSDEYHAPPRDRDNTPNTCRFCGEPWGDHEHACPHSKEDDPVYLELREPWTETP